jgi:hypothetical protein
MWRKVYMAISPDSFTHFVYGSDAIRFSKVVPCQAQGKVKKPREEAATRDEVQWRMQFEQHQFARLERLKIGCRRWTPEIDFFHLRAGCVEIKPVLIRYGKRIFAQLVSIKSLQPPDIFEERTAS